MENKRRKKEADKEEEKRKKRSVNGGSTCKAWTGEKLKIQVAMVLTIDGNSLTGAHVKRAIFVIRPVLIIV